MHFFFFVLAALLPAQAPYYSSVKAVDAAQDIPANRGSAAVWQSLKKLSTRASLIMVTAHPDDEDGGMLTYHSRGVGTRVSLLTLNRGEGGANVMSPEFFDGLGLVRTMELLEAGRYYGVDQYWTRLVDYGFSKTKEEALGHWTRERTLYDAVRVVRMTRPLVVTSVFVGGPSDGHGNHEVAGLMAKEVYHAAGDPAIFPDQIRAGLRAWAPLKYYARLPFRRGGATSPLSADVEIPSGEYDPLLGTTYAQIAREGLGMQKSQTGGPAGTTRPAGAYHRYESRVPADGKEKSFFDGIDTSLLGIAGLAGKEDASFLTPRLQAIAGLVNQALAEFKATKPDAIAGLLAKGLTEIEASLAAVASSRLSDGAKYDIRHELEIKKAQFNHALAGALGVSVIANVGGEFRMAIPGQKFPVRVQVANLSGAPVKVEKTYFQTPNKEQWQTTAGEIEVPANATFTRPYFMRPGLEQAYYNLTDERYLNLPLSPYPLAAWAEFSFEGATFRVGQVVQTTQRVTGLGAVSEPLVVGPAVSVSIQPHTGIIPLASKSFPLSVVVHSNVKGPAKGSVKLELPTGWKATPERAGFDIASDGAEQALEFTVTPGRVESKSYECTAVAEFGGRQYREGYHVSGYAGLRPYFLYRSSTHKTSGVDVKVAPGLKIAYVTGSGDDVPAAMTNLGLKVTYLSAADLGSGDLAKFDLILLGVRAYAAREDVKSNNARLLEYVDKGGVVIVQYNTPEYDHNYGPYPYVMGGNPEEVTDETSKMEILDASNQIFNWPNKITAKDFDGWVEERGSKFLQSWDPRYTALLSTQDAGQAPQKGGLLFARYGKGIYVYNAYAFYRQLPEGVAGAYRLFANLVSLARKPQ